MAVNVGDSTKRSLKQINEIWFINVGGRLKALKMLSNSTKVTLKDDVIFADEKQYQLIEESNGEISIKGIDDIKFYSSEHKLESSKSGEVDAKNKDASKVALTVPINRKPSKYLTRPNKKQNIELVECADVYVYDDEKYASSEKLGNEQNVKVDGKIMTFFNQLKRKFSRKKSKTSKQIGYIYEDFPNDSENHLPADYSKEDVATYEEVLPRLSCCDAVPGSRSVTAMFDFKRFSDDEISFKRLDKLKIRDNITSVNIDWCYAEHLSTRKKGFIPIAFVTQSNEILTSQEWWHDIDRDAAEELLTKCETSTVGTYLIRPSGKGRFALSMLLPKKGYQGLRIAHYQIKSEGDRIFISNKSKFDDIFALVDNYKRQADGLPCALSNTITKQCPFVYPRRIEIERTSIELVKSINIGKFEDLFTGKLGDTFDVTIVKNCKGKRDQLLAEVQILYEFRQSKRFIKVVAAVLNSQPFMIVLGETVKDTLKHYLKTDMGKTISFENLTRMASEIALGMAYLEEKGIVHGNLKAENVYICDLNKPKIVHSKLLKLLETKAKDENDWKWTAPEVIADKNASSTKSDIWSFGVMMYEMISFGEIPYAGFEKEEALHGLSNGLRLPIPKGGPFECPAEFYHTILQCWHQSPECRLTFEFVGEFLSDFKNAIEYYPIVDQKRFRKGSLLKGKMSTEQVNNFDTHIYVNINSLFRQDNRKGEFEPKSEDNASSKDAVIKKQSLLGNFEADVTFHVKAIAFLDYKAEDDDEISFDPGEIITNIDQIDEGWWIGTTSSGARGIFPANYVKLCES